MYRLLVARISQHALLRGGECLVLGGRVVYLVPGGCSWSGGCTPGPGGCTVPGLGVYLVRGGAPGLWGVVYLVRGGTWSGGLWGGYLARHSLPPVNRMTNRSKILPCPKLRLRAVRIILVSRCDSHCSLQNVDSVRDSYQASCINETRCLHSSSSHSTVPTVLLAPFLQCM